MKRWLMILLTCVLVLGLGACTHEKEASGQEADPGYDVTLTLKCHKNLIFSKYGIKVYVDDVELGTIEHGSSGIYLLDLKDGEHKLSVEKADDKTIRGTMDFSVSQDTKLAYEATCSSIDIEIKEGISEEDEEATTSEKLVIRATTEEKATTRQKAAATTGKKTTERKTSAKKSTQAATDNEILPTTEKRPATTAKKPETTTEEKLPPAPIVEATTEAPPKTEATTEEATVTAGEDEIREETETYGDLSITMLDVGQGLSILVECDGEYMLYDGGGRERSSYVVAYLKEHNITNFKYIVASHYDEDHIAGLVGVLNITTVEKAIIPNLTADTKIYESLMGMLDTAQPEIIYPSLGDTYMLGKAELKVLGPEQMDASDENNSSIVMKLTLGEFSALLCGDAETEEEAELMASGEDLSSTLLVVGHHGSASSTSEEFLKTVNPAYAFISVGAGNAYGHPTKETLDRLAAMELKMFRTDLQQEVTLTTDGTLLAITTNVPACEDYSPGVIEEATEDKAETPVVKKEVPTANEDGKTDYILNVNSQKIHYPSCKSVKQMSDKNKSEVSLNDEELKALKDKGYTDCQNCH